ncbi:MAG: hypothetical protein FWD22_00545 [Treponema sp.]|nr:hypothetical protein [Treponema sp.]
MGDILYLLLLTICGIILVWIGSFLFFGPVSPIYPFLPWSKKNKKFKGRPGDAKVCPVCSIIMVKGDLVKTIAFPSAGSIDRLMYIKGCYSCIENDLPRKCPICGAKMSLDDFLVARFFERPYEKNHVHVLGCNQCKKV